LYAVAVIERVHKAGGKIISFLSYCGGLPAPEGMRIQIIYKTTKANIQTLEIH
jgi:saccharopine dehydrogenase (NADP+, L-glutamate forming)